MTTNDQDIDPSSTQSQGKLPGLGRPLVSLTVAAKHFHTSPRALRGLIAKGLLPGPLPGTRRYDLKAMEAALDCLAGLKQPSPDDAYEEWSTKNDEEI